MNKLYPKLAFTNIRNNRQFYLPYILTGILCVLMFYSVLGIQQNPALSGIPGGANIKIILLFGTWVIAFFSCIFLFYTNSFIVKRRKKELGMYNILGMEKRHIARVMLLETGSLAIITIAGGLVSGIVFNKLFMMLLYRLTGLSESIPFYISGAACLQSVILFGGIYVATLLYNFMQIKLANPVELLRSGNTGEREPKTKVLMTIVGVICIALGYYIAITTENPIQVVGLFFVAVLLVIVGTYCLFTAGSIAVLKLLRKNKRYYYQTRHFTTVSGMLYRMKQNAVGLANICILSTMVLVMISCTVSMYVGVEDELDARYPEEISVVAYYENGVPEGDDGLAEALVQSLKESGRIITGEQTAFSFTIMAGMEENRVKMIGAEEYDSLDQNFLLISFCTKEDYEAVTGETVGELKPGEVAAAFEPFYGKNTITIAGTEYPVAESLSCEAEASYMMVAGEGIIIVPDKEELERLFLEVKTEYEAATGTALRMEHQIGIDIDGNAEEKLAAEEALNQVLAQWDEEQSNRAQENDAGYHYVVMETRQESYEDFYSLYGSLFFLGLFLGILFLMITVLIIFYKQISEGYDDKERFAIMEKVGMSNAEVKAAISSQVRMVFFLPLVTAGIHLAAAFPMLTRLLALLNLTNTTLFIWCLAGTVLVFAVIYLAVFKLTSRSYYKIVGNQI